MPLTLYGLLWINKDYDFLKIGPRLARWSVPVPASFSKSPVRAVAGGPLPGGITPDQVQSAIGQFKAKNNNPAPTIPSPTTPPDAAPPAGPVIGNQPAADGAPGEPAGATAARDGWSRGETGRNAGRDRTSGD